MRAEAMAGRLCTCFAGGNKDNNTLANQKIACIEKRMESSKRIDEEYDENHWIKPVYFPRAEASLSEMRISIRKKKEEVSYRTGHCCS
jgi:hypothetical protein